MLPGACARCLSGTSRFSLSLSCEARRRLLFAAIAVRLSLFYWRFRLSHALDVDGRQEPLRARRCGRIQGI
jgi:hypothetical protein